MDNNRLKEILRNAIVAYEHELEMQDYETIAEEHFVLLNEFDMTEMEYQEIKYGKTAIMKDAKFTSVWDDGYEVTTNCKVNLVTKEIIDIEIADVDGLDVLDYEYVTIDDINYIVSNDSAKTEYWYF